MIQFFLLVSRQGKCRLSKWYAAYSEKEKRKMVREVSQLCLNRPQKLCNFLGELRAAQAGAVVARRGRSAPASEPAARGALQTRVAAQQRSRRAGGALARSRTGGVIKACACLLSVLCRDCDLRVARVQAHLQTLREPLFHNLRSVSQRAPLSCSSGGALCLLVRDACAMFPLTPLPSQPLFLLTLRSRRRHHHHRNIALLPVDKTDNELITLEVIHQFVEVRPHVMSPLSAPIALGDASPQRRLLCRCSIGISAMCANWISSSISTRRTTSWTSSS
jgi:hypothetical protein